MPHQSSVGLRRLLTSASCSLARMLRSSFLSVMRSVMFRRRIFSSISFLRICGKITHHRLLAKSRMTGCRKGPAHWGFRNTVTAKRVFTMVDSVRHTRTLYQSARCGKLQTGEATDDSHFYIISFCTSIRSISM
jgi:hypothetical protein